MIYCSYYIPREGGCAMENDQELYLITHLGAGSFCVNEWCGDHHGQNAYLNSDEISAIAHALRQQYEIVRDAAGDCYGKLTLAQLDNLLATFEVLRGVPRPSQQKEHIAV